ncbi:MAG: nucleoside triphosphate pyrophosphatase [Myxococcota bacterium]|nr:nucleoside triphosphate pyrophosphatase [Myxococcota bacterium]
MNPLGRLALVLASSSPWRRELLHHAGVPCDVVAPRVDEERIRAEDPVSLALARARAKAREVSHRYPGRMVLGADQVVHLDGRVFGKPKELEVWREQLQALRGRTHELTTGCCLVAPDGVEQGWHETTRVTFRSDLTASDLDDYLGTGEGLECAGGYQVERRGAWLIERLDGDWFNVVGLPVLSVVGRLRQAGWTLDGAG